MWRCRCCRWGFGISAGSRWFEAAGLAVAGGSHVEVLRHFHVPVTVIDNLEPDARPACRSACRPPDRRARHRLRQERGWPLRIATQTDTPGTSRPALTSYLCHSSRYSTTRERSVLFVSEGF